MPETVSLSVNGVTVTLPAGSTVSAAILIAGVTRFRRSITGQPRGPHCGMGICFESRVTINGQEHDCSCQIPCRNGMVVKTD